VARYADWYAVELDSYLKGRTSDVHRFEAVQEVTSHFAEHVEELVGKGMDPIEAEKAAIKAFGTPRTAAVNLLQGNSKPKLGAFFTSLSCLTMIVILLFMTFFGFCSFMEYWRIGLFRFALPIIATTGGIFGITLLVGTFLSRAVPIRKLLFTWCIGAVISGGFLLFGPEIRYAGIQPSEFNTAMKNWKEIRKGTLTLGEITSDVAKIVDKYPHTSDEMHTYYPAADSHRTMPSDSQKVADLAKISTLAQQSLAIKHDLVSIVGRETSGYLVPEEGLPNRDRTNGFYPASQYVASDDKEPIVRTRLVLAYTKDPKLVVQAWQNSGYVMYGNSQFKMMASRQDDFINRAAAMATRSRFKITGIALGALALYSLPILLFALVICWAFAGVPKLLVRSTFRRRIA
jgi:hypothetical protein